MICKLAPRELLSFVTTITLPNESASHQTMEYFYIGLLVFLGLVAIFDIFVGVSNDAVNFLNSALGCRIASFKTTLFVASIGVMLGATFSSGMMEIARSGVFHPQMFSFAEIMIIFFAVMVADIILLDTFNSLGLPTSTTVSIVFELLGSAVAAAAYTLLADGKALTEVIAYINSSKALTIVSGILISVVVAFISGAVVQWIARLIFSFHFETMYRRVGGIFAGLALTSIIYFLVMKGAKGASFMRPEWISYMNDHTGAIVSTLFIGLSILFQALILIKNINVFKIVILAGTFSLAFAFAGNDLVNFVGVPLAAWDSYREWAASGVAAESFMMAGLLKPTVAPTAMLLFSGLVMVLTLCFSRKAYRVIQTSISLSATNSGEQEQFGASLPGRMIVRASLGANRVLRQIIPIGVQRSISSRFVQKTMARGETPLPFDYVRASINLVVSAVLIASATSLKLPLSTTYVTFMVAMGSSFADGAWDRESAVYRISGVLTVISGWFITALAASTLAAVICALTFWGGEAAAVVLALFATVLLVRSNLRANREEKEKIIQADTHYDAATICTLINVKSAEHLKQTVSLYAELVRNFLADSESGLRTAKTQCNELFDTLSAERSLYYGMANARYTTSKADLDARYCYYHIYTNMRETGRTMQSLAKLVSDHVANRHRIYTGALKEELENLVVYLAGITEREDGRADVATLSKNATQAIERIDSLQAELLRRIPAEKLSVRGCEVYLHFLLTARDLINHYSMADVMTERLKWVAKDTDLAA